MITATARTLAAAVAISLIAAGGALAQDGAPKADPAAKPATPPSAPAATPPAAPVEPPNPKAIPVPDLPIVEKKELEGGILVEDMRIGDGYEIKPGGAVVCHYHGTLKEGGKKFDSSFERGEPIAFSLQGVIPGWQQGVPGMKIGGIRRLTIPAKLGYGERGAGEDIPPNSDLVFVIQLVDAMQIEDVKAGEGEEVGPRPVCVTAQTFTGADGKELEKFTRELPYVWLPGEHQGISLGLEGMKVGGKRKVKIPAQFNITAQGAPNPSNRPSDVPVTVEIELIAVKNLVPPQPKK